MAQQTKSTHQAHCQVCGRLQAIIANDTGTLAKHGYKVKGWGYFMGTCTGSDRLPLEVERNLTDRTCTALTEYAAENDRAAADFRSGAMRPMFCRGAYDAKTRDYVRVDWNEATALQQSDEVNRQVWSRENAASSARAHVTYMQKLAARVHGTDPLPIKTEKRVAPAAPTVDVEKGTVSGTYATKAARQADLDKLQRQYETLRRMLSDRYLSTPRDQQTKEATEFYYGVTSLSQWRPKHSALAIKLYDARWVVARIEDLVKAREAVKNA